MNIQPKNSKIVLYLVLVFLYLPVVILIVFSFNNSRFSLEWNGFTLRWYNLLLHSPETGLALENTIIVSLASTIISTILGTLLGIGLHLYRFPGKRALELLFYLPIIIPDIIMAIALLFFYFILHITLGLFSIILAHVAFQVSFVALVVRSRMQNFCTEIIEAARDLGASHTRVLTRIIFPLAKPGIAAGALIAFTLSVDDFLITYFTAGVGSSTLPIRIYSMVKRGVTPDINALSTLVLLFTFLTLYLGLKFIHKKND